MKTAAMIVHPEIQRAQGIRARILKDYKKPELAKYLQIIYQ